MSTHVYSLACDQLHTYLISLLRPYIGFCPPNSVEAIHYFNEFVLVGPAGQQQCATSVQSNLSAKKTDGGAEA